MALGGSSKGPEIREKTEMCSACSRACTHGKQIKVGYKKKNHLKNKSPPTGPVFQNLL